MLRRYIQGALRRPLLPVTAAILMALVQSAAASVLLSPTDVGSTFTVLFDGNVSNTPVTGLAGQADFTLNSLTGNSASFSVVLTNMSFGGITSRISSLGFDVDRAISTASVSGLFNNYHLNGSYPNNFGSIDICFNNTNSCQGGGGSGVDTGQNGSFNFTLNFSGPPSTNLTLSNFGVRYQSIEGTTLGTSGTGTGTYIPGDVPQVPEPGTFMLLGSGLVAAAIIPRLRRRS